VHATATKKQKENDDRNNYQKEKKPFFRVIRYDDIMGSVIADLHGGEKYL